MQIKNRAFAIAGGLFWLVLLAVIAQAVTREPKTREVGTRMARQLFGEPRTTKALFPASSHIEAGQPVRVYQGRELFQAGEIVRVDENGRCEVAIYPEYESQIGSQSQLIAYTTSGDIGWVLRTLVPEELRAEIQSIAVERWRKDESRLIEELTPGLKRLVKDIARALESDLPRVVALHEGDFAQIGKVLEQEGWNKNLSGVFQDEVWPMLRERATPVLSTIGNELVEAFPIGGTAWDLVLEKVALGEEDRVRRRLERFLNRKGIPIVAKHEDELREIATQVIRDTVAHPKTKKALESALHAVMRDSRFQDALIDILRTWIVKNGALRDILESAWDRDDIRKPLLSFFNRMTPDFHRIANRIVLDEDKKGLNPELARVLRRKILREDERWILLELGEPGPFPETITAIDGGTK